MQILAIFVHSIFPISFFLNNTENLLKCVKDSNWHFSHVLSSAVYTTLCKTSVLIK